MNNINLEDLWICSISDSRKKTVNGFSDHCKTQCFHGRFHYKKDCNEEFCNLYEPSEKLEEGQYPEAVKVKCRKIKKKEIKVLQEMLDTQDGLDCGKSKEGLKEFIIS